MSDDNDNDGHDNDTADVYHYDKRPPLHSRQLSCSPQFHRNHDHYAKIKMTSKQEKQKGQ